jgi:hypothetical protein
MGVKIHELYSGPTIKSDDVLPLTQDINGTDRITLKATISQVKEKINEDINITLNNIEIDLNNKNFDKSKFDKLLRVDGTKFMKGNLYMDNSTIINYSARIINITDNYTLTPEDNASVLLVNKNDTTNSNSRVEININENSLPVGFNIIIIQTGFDKVKITTNGNLEIWSTDGYKTTKQKYSSINLCILKSNKIWLYGDMVLD